MTCGLKSQETRSIISDCEPYRPRSPTYSLCGWALIFHGTGSRDRGQLQRPPQGGPGGEGRDSLREGERASWSLDTDSENSCSQGKWKALCSASPHFCCVIPRGWLFRILPRLPRGLPVSCFPGRDEEKRIVFMFPVRSSRTPRSTSQGTKDGGLLIGVQWPGVKRAQKKH